MGKKVDNSYLKLDKKQKQVLLNRLGVNDILYLDTAILALLKDSFKKVTDKRQKWKITYKIWDIICYVVVASFCDIYDWDEIVDFINTKKDFFKRFLKMTGGIPSSQTIERVFSLIKPSELEKILTDFFLEYTHNNSTEIDIINFDGRVDRGSSRNATSNRSKIKPLNCLNAYSNKYGICLGTEMIDEKTNEIPAIPDLIDRLNIKGTVITWDALNTQTVNISKVIDSKADYVVPIKGNQGNFFDDLKLYFDDKRLEMIIAGNTKSSYKREIEKSHACFIIYEYFQTLDVKWYKDVEKWKGLHSIGMVKKTITKNNNTIIENRYYISSLFLDIDLFSNSIRNHWSVENKLHWHLDFTFREDKNTTVNKNALANLQIVNKFVLAVLNKVKLFYENISLRRIKNIITMDFENQFINLLCYMLF